MHSQVEGLEAGEIKVPLQRYRAIGQQHRTQVGQQLTDLLPGNKPAEVRDGDEIIVEPREVRARLKAGRSQIVGHIVICVAGAGVVASRQQPGSQGCFVQPTAGDAQLRQHVRQCLGGDAQIRQLLQQHESRGFDTAQLSSILGVERIGVRNHLLARRQSHRSIVSLHRQRQKELARFKRSYRQGIVRSAQVDAEQALVGGHIQGLFKEGLPPRWRRIEAKSNSPGASHRVAHRVGQKPLVRKGRRRCRLSRQSHRNQEKGRKPRNPAHASPPHHCAIETVRV